MRRTPPEPAQVDDDAFHLSWDVLEALLWRVAGGLRVADALEELCQAREAEKP